jgi:hypothetical protein
MPTKENLNLFFGKKSRNRFKKAYRKKTKRSCMYNWLEIIVFFQFFAVRTFFPKIFSEFADFSATHFLKQLACNAFYHAHALH